MNSGNNLQLILIATLNNISKLHKQVLSTPIYIYIYIKKSYLVRVFNLRPFQYTMGVDSSPKLTRIEL